MSTVQPTDKTLVNRAGVDYSAPADMSTVQDTDLLLINRAGVDYKCTFLDWKNSQTKAPDVGTVTLADVAGGARFTSTAFPVSATMTNDGVPPSTKGLKAWVEGTLKSKAVSDEITAAAGTGNPGTLGNPGYVVYKSAFTASSSAQGVVYGKTAQDANNDANHPAFQWAAGLNIGGFTDWYIPAKNESEIIYRNLKPTTFDNVTSYGSNPNAVPPTTNYTTSDPPQTSVAAFRQGCAEAYKHDTLYWTATEDSGNAGRALQASFFNGPISGNSKPDSTCTARAIRRVAFTGTEPAIGAAYQGGYFAGLISTAGNGVADYALIVAPNATGTYGYTGGTAADPLVLTLKTDKDLANFAAGDAVKQNGPTAGAPPTLAFATTLYTGTGATQTITNGIDLAGEGGLVWAKSRSSGTSHELVDTVRGGGNGLRTNQTDGTISTDITGFTSSGFTLGLASGDTNQAGYSCASWTFRKGGGFFDIVTYTGDGNTAKTINHNLGSVPGFIIVKRTDAAGSWEGYHSALGAGQTIRLNSNGQYVTTSGVWNDVVPTATNFTVGNNANVNHSSATYVAYLFGSDDTNIKCGSYTGNGASQTINCGFQPGWVLIKCSNARTTDWQIFDKEREANPNTSASRPLKPNLSDLEGLGGRTFAFTATGFSWTAEASGDYNKSGNTYVYIAIKDGAVAPGGTPSGVVASTDATTKTMTLSSSSGTWGVNTGNWVIGPEKTVANTKLFTVHNAAGVVSDLQSADPGYVTMAGSSPYTLTFPATLPTGNAPDVDLPAGTQLTTEIQATSTGSPSVTKTSNTITPV